MRNTRRPTSGFFLADALAAMVVLSAVIIALGVAVDGQRRVGARCAQTRLAAGIAERAALELLTTGVVPEEIDEKRIRTRQLENSPGGIWTEVIVELETREFSLVVLVPATKPGKEQRP